MTIQVNGEEHTFEEPLTVTERLARLEMRGPVVVELNGLALHRREHETARVEDGARVEIIRIAAGG